MIERVRTGPLSGVRVLEFSTAWAGPYAGRALAFLGAEVIKIEAPNHPDSWRGTRSAGAPVYYPELTPGESPQNRSVLFNSQNIDKLSIGLNLKLDGALGVMYKLVEQADVVLANFTPGVLDRLGIGHADLSKINPRIIVVEMPAFGPGGPMATHQGMGKTMEPAAGMTALMGYGDGKPVLTGPAIVDPTGGLNAVSATVTALELRERTGVGSRVELAQVEAASHWIGEFVLANADTGINPTPQGNRVDYAAPHDAFACAGDDEWVVIAVEEADQWMALCRAIGDAGLVDDPRFATLEARLAHQDELDPIIESWTARHGKWEAAGLLQSVGVPAAPVLGGAEIAESEAMREADGLIVSLNHSAVGTRDYSAFGFRHGRTQGAHRYAAPLFGEHNDEVLGDLLGFDPTEIAELRASGAVGDRPTADTDTPRTVQTTDVSAAASDGHLEPAKGGHA
ncbi:crotonobetainyl-CoA:carnitine CoA-transferase CaiB-like acyl-CoA transferase [Antricoccus suffuscus]|uniref:Crotonobetainyl-CoA:carnitine CoA-transferase CaiB-like acyl-CoA transferase n=1 Tax=Antricoccus suffuscus TaxID=1629062 RepID=A0A2T1A6J7_9ACTN|nr:CoA transferase [Antricoccus suffuscus]PRZ44235.1 crotonobetainyl-CoA:carnitine CoA-transferase CaiB-like acyl-CoA transferase [Antricoccus suffuscus]